MTLLLHVKVAFLRKAEPKQRLKQLKVLMKIATQKILRILQKLLQEQLLQLALMESLLAINPLLPSPKTSYLRRRRGKWEYVQLECSFLVLF